VEVSATQTEPSTSAFVGGSSLSGKRRPLVCSRTKKLFENAKVLSRCAEQRVEGCAFAGQAKKD
jgi:hypothetical protein